MKIEFHYRGVRTCILIGVIYMPLMSELNEQFLAENKPIKRNKIAYYIISM